MINKLKKYLSTKQGFTLVETLIAVFILSTSIAAPLTVASRALTTALVAKDQITAFYLAQDAVEYVRFARDTNRLAGGNWITGAGGTGATINLTPCLNALGCYLDSTSISPAIPTVCPVPAGTSCTVSTPTTNASNLYFDNTNKRYTYTSSGNTKTFFTRKVTITNAVADEAVLTVTVYWVDTGYVVRSVVISENLFNWQ